MLKAVRDRSEPGTSVPKSSHIVSTSIFGDQFERNPFSKPNEPPMATEKVSKTMANSPRLKTGDASGMKDVSLSSSGGVITQGGSSAFKAAFTTNPIQGNPSVPCSDKETEIATVEGAESNQVFDATVSDTDHPTPIREVVTKGPVVARPDQPGPMRAR